VLPIAAASASVLPPPPAQRSSTCLPFTSPAAAAATWLPRSCTSNQPLENCGIASTAPLRSAAAGASMRSAWAASRRGWASSGVRAFSARAGSVFSTLTRRSTGARSARAAISSALVSPNTRAIDGSSQSG